MKVYFIHVYRHRWEFYPAGEASGLEAMDVDEESAPSGFLHWLAHRASLIRSSIENAESGYQLRLRRMLERLDSRVDPTEPFLRRLRSAETVEIVHPADVSARFVRRKLRLLLIRKTIKHKRGIYLNAIFLPFSIAATLIPGPNVFLFWNAYRLVSHVLAHRGGTQILAGETPIVFTPSEELAEVRGSHRRRASPLDLDVASRIAERLHLHGFVDYLRRTDGLAGEPADDGRARP